MAFIPYFFTTSFISAFLLTTACAGQAEMDTSQGNPSENMHHKLDAINFTGAYLAARSARIHYDFENAQKNAENSFVLTSMDEPFLADQAIRLSLIQGNFDTAVSLANQHIKQFDQDTIDKPVGIFSVMTLLIDKIKNDKPKEALEIFEKFQKSFNKPMRALIGGTVYRLNGNLKKANLIEANIGGFALFDMMRQYHVANSHFVAGDLDKAIELYKKSGSHLDILSTRPILSAVQLYVNKGDKKTAVDIITQHKKNQPDSLLWSASERLKKQDEFFFDIPKTYLQVLGEDLYNIGVLYARQNDFESALAFFKSAEIANVKHAYLKSTLAETYATIKDFNTASELYLDIAQDRKFLIGRESLIKAAFTLAAAERHDEAFNLLKDAIKNDPKYYRFVYVLADLLRNQEKHKEAIPYFTQALKLVEGKKSKNEWRILYGRGISYEQTDQWDKAENDFLAALKLAPNNPDLINYLAYSWVDRNIHLDKALKMLQHAVRKRPNSGYITDSLGWAYFRIKEYDKALPILEKAVALMPNDPVINDHLGDAYWKVGRTREAEFQWSHALAFKPKAKDKKLIDLKLAHGYEKAHLGTYASASSVNESITKSQGQTNTSVKATEESSSSWIGVIKSFIDKFK